MTGAAGSIRMTGPVARRCSATDIGGYRRPQLGPRRSMASVTDWRHDALRIRPEHEPHEAAREAARMSAASPTDPDLALWRLAGAGVDNVLELIGAEDWARWTPCTDWNVRDLVNHLVGSNLRHIALLRGGSEREFWRVRAEERVLRDDPLADWKESADALDAAFAEPGVMDRPINYRLRTGRALLHGRVFDVTVHTWDLAQAVGADSTLDERLVAACLATPLAAVLARGEGIPATIDYEQLAVPPAGPLPAGASEQERLLWLCGRLPRGDEEPRLGPDGPYA